MKEDVKSKLCLLIGEDINVLIKRIKEIYEPFGQSFQSSEGNLKSFSIDFSLFINLVNKHCYKCDIPFSDNFISVLNKISFSQDFQKYIEENSIFKERLERFKKIFIIPFYRIQLATHYNIIDTFDISIIGLYYLFYYQIFIDFIFRKIEIRINLENLLTQWNDLLEGKPISVNIRVEMDTIILDNELNFNDQFQIILTNHSHIEKINPFRSKLYIPYCLLFKAKINIKKYDSNEIDKKDSFELFREIESIKEEIQKFMSALYLYGISMTKNKLVIQLPWWYEPNYMFLKKSLKSRQNREFPIRNFQLKSKDCSKIIKIYAELLDKDFFIKNNYPLSWSFLKMGLSESISLERIFYAHILLEFLFSPNDQTDISFDIPLTCASLISEDYTEFRKSFYLLRKMYSIRSKAIHGDNWNLEIQQSIKNLKKKNIEIENIQDLFKNFEGLIIRIVKAILVYDSIQSHIIDNIKNKDLINFYMKEFKFLLRMEEEYKSNNQFRLKILFKASKIAQFLEENCCYKIEEIYNENPAQIVYKKELNLILEELNHIQENNSQKRQLAEIILDSFSKLTKKKDNQKRNNDIKLTINGNDIMKMDRKKLNPGPIIGSIKEHLINKIRKGELDNNRLDLLNYLRDLNPNDFLKDDSEKNV